MIAWRVEGMLACAALVLAACGRAPDQPMPQPQAQAQPEAADPGYRGPPEPLGTSRAADGAVTLSGRAIASSTIRMASPAGARAETVADGSGVWKAPLGPVSEPTLYRLAEEIQVQGQTQRIEAEGYVLVLPGAAAILRAGVGALSLDTASPVLRLQAVDFDTGGAAVVSGQAPASSPLRLLVDGTPAADGAAGPDGRFSLTLAKPLGPGAHKIQAATAAAMAAADITFSPPMPPADAPYKATQQGSAWRIDWLTPGGGPQTTLLLGG